MVLQKELSVLINYYMFHMCFSVSFNFSRTVQILINLGANISCTDCLWMTPLCHAAKNGFSQIISILLKNGAFIDACDKNRTTPLHHASTYGHVNCIDLLLNNNASIQAKDQSGKSCLDLAIENKLVDACIAIVKDRRWVDFI